VKTCAICGAFADDAAVTCPLDGEASWMRKPQTVEEMLVAMPTLEEVAPEPKRGPGRPKKVSQ
jgi:hypothetical protein